MSALINPWPEQGRGRPAGPRRTMNPVVRDALAEIALRHGFTVETLLSLEKPRLALNARRECYEWLRQRRWSYQQIGWLFSDRDTSSIAFALQTGVERERRLERCRKAVRAQRARAAA
jgi:hypothetical protein